MPEFLCTWLPHSMECSFGASSTNQEKLAIQRGHNRHVVAVNSKKHSGKTPISRLCSMFIDQGGDIAL